MSIPFTQLAIAGLLAAWAGRFIGQPKGLAPADGQTPTFVPVAADAREEKPGRVVGVPVGWKLVGRATYTASQTAGEVIVKATGEHPSAGYETKLIASPPEVWPPRYLLIAKKPAGPAAAVMTPFEVSASFKAKEPVAKVVVTDAAGAHEVTVGEGKGDKS